MTLVEQLAKEKDLIKIENEALKSQLAAWKEIVKAYEALVANRVLPPLPIPEAEILESTLECCCECRCCKNSDEPEKSSALIGQYSNDCNIYVNLIKELEAGTATVSTRGTVKNWLRDLIWSNQNDDIHLELPPELAEGFYKFLRGEVNMFKAGRVPPKALVDTQKYICGFIIENRGEA